MKVPSEAWDAIVRIINYEFVQSGEPMTPKLLVQLIKEVSEEYTVDNE